MLFTIILFIAVLAVLVLSHEFGHFIVAKRNGIKVEEFGIGFPPRLFGRKIGETLYSINLFPLGGFVRMEGEDGEMASPRSFSAATISVRSQVIAAGVFANFIVAFLVFSIVQWIGSPVVIDPEVGVPPGVEDVQVRVVKVAENSPAGRAGLHYADTLLRLESGGAELDIKSITGVQEFVKHHLGIKMGATVRRGNKTLVLDITPRLNPPEGEGAIGIAMLETAFQRAPWYKAPILAFQRTFEITGAVIQMFIQLVVSAFGGPSVAGSIAGPVGIAVLIGDTTRLGIIYLFELIALLSVNLAVINILPLPALDGGRLFFLLIEKIKGAPLGTRIPHLVHTVGFLALIILLLFVTYLDIVRFF